MEAALLSLSAPATIRSVLPALRLRSRSVRPELRARPALWEQLAPQASPGPPERRERPVLLELRVRPVRRERPVLPERRVRPARLARPARLVRRERWVRQVLPGQRVRPVRPARLARQERQVQQAQRVLTE